jgi:hypothetical protein
MGRRPDLAAEPGAPAPAEPGGPAGVGKGAPRHAPSFETASPAGQAGRGRERGLPPGLAAELLHLPGKPAGVGHRAVGLLAVGVILAQWSRPFVRGGLADLWASAAAGSES